MNSDPEHIAADFDARSANYAKNLWHRDYAEGLVAHSAVAAGARVLDAGVGTGFAALAAARRRVEAGQKVARVAEHAAVLHWACVKWSPLRINRHRAGRWVSAQPSGQCITSRSWSVMMITTFGFFEKSVSFMASPFVGT